MRSGWFAGTMVVLVCILCAGCATETPTPRPASATAELPTPQVRQPSLPERTSLPPEPPNTPTATPIPASLEEMARDVYGQRLIEWLDLPAIGVRAPVRAVGWSVASADGLPEWDNPEAEVGWVVSSALPGDAGNIILYGHNNIHSSIFKRLSEMQPGDEVTIETGIEQHVYRVSEVVIIPVSGADANLTAYQQYLGAAEDETLMLLSCWPPDNNTHRVIVLAVPSN